MKGKYPFETLKKWPWLGELYISDIVIPDIRVTSVMPEDLQEQFKGSIQVQGVLNPVKCVWDGQRIILVDGLHRIMEARNAGHEKVPAVVVPGDLKKCLLENLTTGKLQGRGKVTDMIRTVRYLIEEEGMDTAEVAASTGYKLDYIEDMLAIAKAHPDLLKALDDELIPLGAARELARIPEPEVMLRLLYQVIMYRMKVSDVKDLVDRTLEVMRKEEEKKKKGIEHRPREEVLLECWVCGEKHPAMHMKSPILCPVCMSVLFEARARVRAELMATPKAGAGAHGHGQGSKPSKTEPEEAEKAEIQIEFAENENLEAEDLEESSEDERFKSL